MRATSAFNSTSPASSAPRRFCSNLRLLSFSCSILLIVFLSNSTVFIRTSLEANCNFVLELGGRGSFSSFEEDGVICSGVWEFGNTIRGVISPENN